MKVRLGTLRSFIRESLREQAWVPGHYYPGAEPLSAEDADRINSKLGEEDELDDLDEINMDPSDNPGRPADPYEYIGMHPSPMAAMSPPHANGGGVGGGGSSSSGTGGVGGEAPDAAEGTDEDA